ncbi:MAG: DUF3667 domain-containing protein [Pedobacter sp.]|nr:MAG: DUF3667 domain-containing protein [Pedobacter sp.]
MSSFKLRKEKDCLNCGHQVDDHFCPKCGQENIEVKENAVHMVAHAIADYFHFEHKFFGTLKPLLFKPGQLTKEYVAGKRVSFIHPIRLYIFVSIVFFIFILGGKNKEKKEVENENNKTAITDSIPKSKADSIQAEKLKTVEEGLKYVPVGGSLRDSILNNAKKEIAKDTSDINTDVTTFRKGKNKWKSKWTIKDTTVVDYEKTQAALPEAKRDGFLKHYFIKRTIELNSYPDPAQKFIEDMLHNVPKMMFLLLPLFALILKLVYINKNKFYYEHLIYSFHLHSAIFLSILFTMLLKWLFGFVYDISEWLVFFCLIYIIWYIYRSLRTFYGSTRWVTVLKLFFLSFAYNIVLTICFLIIIAVSFVMF